MRAYQLGLYEKSMPNTLTIPEKLEVAKAGGFDYLELSIDETEEKLARLDWDDAQILELLRAQEDTGLPISSICLSGHRKYPLGHPDPAIRRRSMDILRQAVDLAARLGVRLIQLAGYDVYYQPGSAQTRELFEAGLREGVDVAAGAGVMLAFETMETDFMNTVSKAMDWVERINSPYLQVYPDSGNLTNAALNAGGDVRRDLERGRGHLAALHLKESVPGKFREVPFGSGHVDFDLVAQTAMALGVRRYLAEFWYVGQEDWREDVAAASRFLRGYLDRAARIPW